LSSSSGDGASAALPEAAGACGAASGAQINAAHAANDTSHISDGGAKCLRFVSINVASCSLGLADPFFVAMNAWRVII
jgi:hypothetical protein